MFKDEIKKEALKQLKKASQNDFQIAVNDGNDVILIYENQEFRYIYEGKRTLVKWLIGKATHFYISGGSVFSQLYLFIKNCVEQKLDYKAELNKMKAIKDL